MLDESRDGRLIIKSRLSLFNGEIDTTSACFHFPRSQRRCTEQRWARNSKADDERGREQAMR